MKDAKKIKVEVRQDHLSQIASGSPESALAEMIWNAFDADATNVYVKFNEGPLGIDEIIISDDGTGMPYSKAENLFKALGGSWKAECKKTENNRFLHGKEGKGRFKAFILGRNVEWNIIYDDNGLLKRYHIVGRQSSLDEFTITDEETVENGKSGVEVRITGLTRKFFLLEKNKAIDKLTPILALYLCNYPSVKINIEGTRITLQR